VHEASLEEIVLAYLDPQRVESKALAEAVAT
jgi:hypothetical protein